MMEYADMPQRRRTTQAIQERARTLRHEQTQAETCLWEYLRDRRLDGYKFRRQHPLGRFIADFYCAEQRLVIELDGLIHQEQRGYDAVRTAALESAGYTVLRWTNDQIERQLATVLEELCQALKGPHPGAARHPSPIAMGEGPKEEQSKQSNSPSPAAAGEGAGGEGHSEGPHLGATRHPSPIAMGEGKELNAISVAVQPSQNLASPSPAAAGEGAGGEGLHP